LVKVEVGMILAKTEYWTAIVDYYYDNIHWAEENPPSIYGWLKREYNADASLYSKNILFKDPSRYTWFILKFGEQCEKLI
jgi:hypothetical protein